MKIILNKGEEGSYFQLSDAAFALYAAKKGLSLYRYGSDHTISHKLISEEEVAKYDVMYATVFLGESVNPFKDFKRDCWLFLGKSNRTDTTLIEVVEELGDKASGNCANLQVVEIPDNIKYFIDDYDGYETLYEIGRKW